MQNEVESILREFAETLLYRTSYYNTHETEETIDEYLPELVNAKTNDIVFDNVMSRMRRTLARNEELNTLLEMRNKNIEHLEALLAKYRTIAKKLCEHWDACEYCEVGNYGDPHERCLLWKLEEEFKEDKDDPRRD